MAGNEVGIISKSLIPILPTSAREHSRLAACATPVPLKTHLNINKTQIPPTENIATYLLSYLLVFFSFITNVLTNASYRTKVFMVMSEFHSSPHQFTDYSIDEIIHYIQTYE